MSSTTLLATDDPLLVELDAWLAANWDPDLTVAEWWERLGTAGWSAPALPEGSYGRGLSRTDAQRVQARIAEFGALGAPGGLGLLLAAPTIVAHGSRRQIDEHVREIVTGRRAWCQLFSEPSAGSDLAGIGTRAVRDGDVWVVNGQKVWTSGGQYADYGMLLARTDPDVPKHQGISYFAFPMLQDGVEVRPLREMTGRSLFNEVFLTGAHVGDDALIGGENRGWAVANTTLMNERAGLGAGAGPMGAGALPGTVAGHLGRRAGDFVASVGAGDTPRRATPSPLGGGVEMLRGLARATGARSNPIVRQDLVRLYTMGEIGRFSGLRLKAAREAGTDIPGLPNIAKLSMSQIIGLSRELGLGMLGAAGMLHSYDPAGAEELGRLTANPWIAMVSELALFSPAPPIYGGTDQVQRNIIGERVLGLPKEPSADRSTPFSELAKNL